MKNQIELDTLIEEVNERFGVDVRQKTRKRNVVYPKKVFCHLARKATLHSLADIGKKLNIQHDNAYLHINTVDSVYDSHKLIYNSIIDDYSLNVPKFEFEEKKELEMPNQDLVKVAVEKLNTLDREKLQDFIEYRLNPYLKLNS